MCRSPAIPATLAAAIVVLAQTVSHAAPVIACDEPSKDFGVVNSNTQSLVNTFTVWNRGDTDLRIQGVHSTCGCTAVDAGDKVVKPGQSTAIKVSFSLRGRRGPQKKDIRVTSNDPLTPQMVLQVACEINLAIDTDVSGFFFSRAVTDSQTVSRTVHLRAASNVTFNVTSVETTAVSFTSFQTAAVQTGRVYAITATIRMDDIPSGFTQERVTVCTDLPGFERIELPVSLYKAEEVLVIPSELPLPESILKQTVIRRDLFLRIQGTNKWEFFDVEPVGNFNVTIEERSPGKCRVAIANLTEIDEVGTQRLAVTLKSPDSSQERRIEVRIRRFQPKRPPVSSATHTNRIGTGTFREIRKKEPKPLL